MQWLGSHIETGTGVVEDKGGLMRLSIPAATAAQYSNAQMDDTTGRPCRRYRWRAPLKLELRARFSHPADELLGTAGFGFWNLPFGPGPARLPALPRTLWFFFGSRPNDLPLATGVPGHGWKAACLDATRPAALTWALLTPLALLAMRNETLYRQLWPHIQQSLAISEAVVPVDLCQWHHYVLDWRPDGADFWVDDQLLLHAPIAPRGPLGFVAWIDNQYAIATPRGRFGWGILDLLRPQWMEIAEMDILDSHETGG